MSKKQPTYYLIKGKILGKRSGEKRILDRLFIDGQWRRDVYHVIQDHLIGYDPFGPDDSPYGIGSLSVIDEMEEISGEKMKEIMGPQIVKYLKKKWIGDFQEEKQEWDRDPGWPAKLVVTKFTLFGTEYAIRPKDLGWDGDGFDQGFMESVQDKMEEDLKAVGAEHVFSDGFLE